MAPRTPVHTVILIARRSSPWAFTRSSTIPINFTKVATTASHGGSSVPSPRDRHMPAAPYATANPTVGGVHQRFTLRSSACAIQLSLLGSRPRHRRSLLVEEGPAAVSRNDLCRHVCTTSSNTQQNGQTRTARRIVVCVSYARVGEARPTQTVLGAVLCIAIDLDDSLIGL